MKLSFLVSLLLLSLFLSKAQGIRLEKGSYAAPQNKHDEERKLLKRNNNGDTDEETVFCKDEHCTGKIKNRKLFTSSASALHAISKKVKTKGNDKVKEFKVVKQEEEDVHEDLMDITDMDYSPARRKTPIHN
ncbi:unnamed protein product [Lathyrus oleraceus]|uniref:Uncharacterized protein n=1 Tax=Pisum sativum TaxID=3888 RepID=A0A9D5BDS4_PEA|nr:uncharacterized protein LOC127084106 [Pisum sativum]KAI5441080.1 hypothetical protein KIW84_010514 [Pisum sativum]